MAKPLDTADFRAIRIVLEPDDFAVSDGKPDGPTDLIEKDTWHGIVDLPDDVSIRTSNHQGTILKELSALQSTWTTHAIGDEQDLLFEVLLYTIDELDAALFNALHGYYRQAIGCLRNMVELVLLGTHCQMAQDTAIFEQWQAGQYENSFGGTCTLLLQHAPVQALNAFLRSIVNDTIINRRNAPQSGGWARRLYAELCEYSHSRPNATNVGLWRSNGPIYVPRAFMITASLYAETLAFCYLLIKLAHPSLLLPKEVAEQLESYQQEESMGVAYQSYQRLFFQQSTPSGK
jgi:hypothetical protein